MNSTFFFIEEVWVSSKLLGCLSLMDSSWKYFVEEEVETMEPQPVGREATRNVPNDKSTALFNLTEVATAESERLFKGTTLSSCPIAHLHASLNFVPINNEHS
jgi:hypothetical protein